MINHPGCGPISKSFTHRILWIEAAMAFYSESRRVQRTHLHRNPSEMHVSPLALTPTALFTARIIQKSPTNLHESNSWARLLRNQASLTPQIKWPILSLFKADSLFCCQCACGLHNWHGGFGRISYMLARSVKLVFTTPHNCVELRYTRVPHPVGVFDRVSMSIDYHHNTA